MGFLRAEGMSLSAGYSTGGIAPLLPATLVFSSFSFEPSGFLFLD